MSAPSSPLRAARNPLAEAAHFARTSKSLASMLPSLLATGAGSLLLTGLVRLLGFGVGHDFFVRWMETWLTTWPIAFPLVYLITCASWAAGKAVASKPAGLGPMDIEAASTAATVKNGLKVRRKRIRTFEVA